MYSLVKSTCAEVARSTEGDSLTLGGSDAATCSDDDDVHDYLYESTREEGLRTNCLTSCSVSFFYHFRNIPNTRPVQSGQNM